MSILLPVWVPSLIKEETCWDVPTDVCLALPGHPLTPNDSFRGNHELRFFSIL